MTSIRIFAEVIYLTNLRGFHTNNIALNFRDKLPNAAKDMFLFRFVYVKIMVIDKYITT